MTTTLAQALAQDHADIDAGIAAFKAAGASASACAALRTTLAALRRHIYLEEAMLFPPMRSGGAFAAIFVMLREHGEMWPLIDALDQRLAQGQAGPQADEPLRQLEQTLAAHNDKEEKIIYSQADAAHAGASAEQMLAFIAGGALPEGWVCERARGAAKAPPFAPKA